MIQKNIRGICPNYIQYDRSYIYIYIKTWFISWFWWWFSNARSVFKKVSIPMYVPKLLVVDEKTMLICAHWGVFLFLSNHISS
jgi:hypothetical protein